MPNYVLSHITHRNQKVYEIKMTKFGTDPILHCFAFFPQTDLGKFNCASADAKEVIFPSRGRNVLLKHRIQLSPGYHVVGPKMHSLKATDKRAQICCIKN